MKKLDVWTLFFNTDLKSKQGRTFHQRVGGKNEEDIWLVDFYAPWLYFHQDRDNDDNVDDIEEKVTNF